MILAKIVKGEEDKIEKMLETMSVIGEASNAQIETYDLDLEETEFIYTDEVAQKDARILPNETADTVFDTRATAYMATGEFSQDFSYDSVDGEILKGATYDIPNIKEKSIQKVE